jgi:type II secretory pathway pseudopilin PulG
MKSGFTLLETLIYIALLGLFLGTLSQAFYFFSDQSSATLEKSLAMTDIIFVEERIEYELSHAQSVAIPPQATSSRLDFISEDGTNGSLIFSSSSSSVVLFQNSASSTLNSQSDLIADLSFDFSNVASSGEIDMHMSSFNGQQLTFSFIQSL